ncbi:MAG: type II secretion system F family protein, partial [Candidatus Omnitrophica bacterium]|nr:type II secretion system F family protein [Candidatus Omnitrophota bacterium]
SGEVSGALDLVLEQLAEQAEREETLRAKVRAAFTYPLFVAVVGCATVIFLMTFVMPRLSQLLVGLGEQLPVPTRLLLAIAGWMASGWFWAGTGGLAAGGALLWRLSGEPGRLLLDRLTLRVPGLGQLLKELELARFARSFGLLINHGVSVLRAMEVAIPVVNHRVIRRQLERLPETLRQGNTLSACLKPLPISTAFLVNTVAVGEESGKVGDGLTEVAAYYERDVERLLQTMATLLEPSLIVAVGLVVGFIVIAVLLPIFEMSSISR